MKHLLIAVMTAILIGTIQAVQRQAYPHRPGPVVPPRTCTFERAVLYWWGGEVEVNDYI